MDGLLWFKIDGGKMGVPRTSKTPKQCLQDFFGETIKVESNSFGPGWHAYIDSDSDWVLFGDIQLDEE